MKHILLMFVLVAGQSSVWACLGGFGGSSGGCCSGPVGGCGAQPPCSGVSYGYNAPIVGPALPPPPPPLPPSQAQLYPSNAGYAQPIGPGPVVPPIGQGSYTYARGRRSLFRK